MATNNKDGSAHPFKHHCFISYSHREPDTSQIRGDLVWFAERLRKAGYSIHELIWIDFDQIGGRQLDRSELERTLAKGIEDSIAVISFVSPKYVLSPWCQFEWFHDEIFRSRAPRRALIWKDIGDPSAYEHHDARRLAEQARLGMLPFDPVTEDELRFGHGPLFDRENWERALYEAERFLDRAYANRMGRWEALHGKVGD